MKNMKFIYYSVIIFLCFAYSCSYDDKTTYADEFIPNIVIDTVGIPVTHVVVREDTLIIKPNVSKEGVSKDMFEYEWLLTLDPGSDFKASKVIGTEEHLRYYVEEIPDASYYGLWYRVTDKTTGLMESIMWQVQVEASSGQGLVVAYTKDNQTTDFAIVQDSLFTLNYMDREADKMLPTSYRYDVFSNQNGHAFKGVVKWMFAQARYLDKRLTYMLHGASKENIFRINTLDFSMLMEGKECFYDPFVTFNIDYYGMCGSYAVLSNNGRLYGLPTEYSTATQPAKFGIDLPGHYTSNSSISEYSYLAWFEPETGKFQTASGYIMTWSTEPSVFVNPSSGPIKEFDLNNMLGYKLLAGGATRQDHCFVLEKDGKIGLYNLTKTSRSPFNPRIYVDISNAPEIGNATSFAFNTLEDVMYYAANNTVYAVIFSGREPKFKEIYRADEPIEFINFLKKTGQKQVPFANKCLLVVTNGDNGKIHALRQKGTNTGEYEFIQTFEGFGGRITAVAVQD